MTRMLLGFAAIVLAVPVSANDGCTSCGAAPPVGHFSGPKTWGPKAHKYERFTGWFHGGSSSSRPAVAPWYLYFPYNGQFQTPGPLGGMNPYGSGMVNPYFPGH